MDSAYTTAKFRRPDAYEGESAISVSGPAPDFIRRAVVVAIEDNMLLIGRFGDYAPTDEDGFRAFAQSLHAPLVYQLVTEAERLTEITHHRFPTSIMRHYERMPSFPEGFLIAGDAVCSFHPIYAQGMSTAALHANGLRQMLAERTAESGGIEGTASAFFAKAAEINSAPWALCANLDFAYPQTSGDRPPASEERSRYLAALDQLQVADIEVQRLMTEVAQLMRPLAALTEEPLRGRVLARMHSERPG